jgi:hypothetical protein
MYHKSGINLSTLPYFLVVSVVIEASIFFLWSLLLGFAATLFAVVVYLLLLLLLRRSMMESAISFTPFHVSSSVSRICSHNLNINARTSETLRHDRDIERGL